MLKEETPIKDVIEAILDKTGYRDELKEEGEIVGFDVDMMRAVCDILGKELVIDDMAFDSVITAVVTGKADVGVAGMTVTEDRLKNVNFSDSYTKANQVVIVRK